MGSRLPPHQRGRRFFSALNEKAAHPFLDEEWKSRKHSQLHVYRTLSDFMTLHFDGVAFSFDKVRIR